MPGRPHHTEKMKRCVEHVKGQGHDESSAYAICTTSLQKASEPIYEGMGSRSAEEMRALGEEEGHPFRGNQYTDGSESKDEKYNRQFTEKADDASVAADTESEDARSGGQYMAAAVAHGKAALLHEEAEIAHKGSDTRVSEKAAAYHARRRQYHEKREREMDKKSKSLRGAEMHHLHLLGATGKARTEMYEGRPHFVVPVVALMEGVIHAVNAENPEFVPYTTLERAAASWNGRPIVLGHPAKDGKQCSANDPVILATLGLGTVFNARMEGKKLYCEAWLDQEKTRRAHKEMYDRLLAGKSEEVSVGAYVVTDNVPGEFGGKSYKATWLEATGDHLAFLPGGRGACSVAMGCGTHRAAAMRVCEDRMELVEETKLITAESKCKCGSHSQSITSGSGPQPKAAGCGCHKTKTGERTMAEKATRAELIAALVTDRYSGFTEVDEPMLEVASENRLEEFKAAADNRKSEERNRIKLEAQLTNAEARLKVAGEQLRAAEQNPTEEEWLAKAPPSIKTLLEAHKQEEDTIKAAIVSQLKDLGAHTENELKSKSLDELKVLAAYARVDVPDYSGRGVPQERGGKHQSSNVNYAPPDPYAAGIKALQSKAVN